MQRGVILYLIMSACCIAASTDPFPPEALPAVSIGEFLPPDFEASGLVWHTRRQKLFLVSDNGFLASMTDQGTDVELWRISADLEAVTVAFPTSDFIYLGVEHPDSIYEFNITTRRVSRAFFNLTPWMDGPKNSRFGRRLTFCAVIRLTPEGGLFYAGLQETGPDFLFFACLSCPALVSTAVTFVGVIYPIQGVNNISDLYYTPCQDVLYAIYDSSNLLRAMTPDGSFLRQWELPGDSQEGITLKGSELYICEDNGQNGGRVYRYAPFLVFPQPDLDNDGIVDLRDYAVFSQCWRDRLFWKTADLNKDNRLDVADIAFFASLWLRGK